ncbi:MAG: hypothetical protein Q9227_002866 [Pyrenula ochraceoflavens]
MAGTDSYRPDYGDTARTPTRTRTQAQMYEFGRDNQRPPESARDFSFRPKASRISERPLLRGNHSNAKDITFSAQSDSQPKFQDIGNVIDSDFEAMDVSDMDEESQRPIKKRIVEDEATIEKPKWSNAEIYSSLPPAADPRRHKDVVKLIRKARVAPAFAEEAQTANLVETNEDFISFDSFTDISQPTGLPPSNAPQGPRAMDSPSNKRKRKREDDLDHEKASPKSRGGRKYGPDRDASSLQSRIRQDHRPDAVKKPGRAGMATKFNGAVLPAWRPSSSTSSTPWFVESTVTATDATLRNGLTS